jgi:hypothetical protein
MILAPKDRLHSSQQPHLRNKGNTASIDEDMVGTNSGSAGLHAGVSSATFAVGGGEVKKEVDRAHLATTTWFLRLCKAFNVVTGLAAALGIFTNFILLDSAWTPEDVAVRIYSLILCLFSILTECEWKRFFGWLAALETWVGRGLNNIFCAVFILLPRCRKVDRFDDAPIEPEADRNRVSKIEMLTTFNGYLLLVLGSLYVLGGLACLSRVKERHLNKIRKRDEALVQREELESRKQEIELLLKDTESQLEKL